MTRLPQRFCHLRSWEHRARDSLTRAATRVAQRPAACARRVPGATGPSAVEARA
jgi:hypothetical protein